MKRSEIYVLIKQYGLEDEVKKEYGVNYTNVYSEGLEKMIARHLETKEEKDAPKECCNDTKFQKLVEVLLKKRILLRSEFDYIMK